jgi:hypothetical protein
LQPAIAAFAERLKANILRSSWPGIAVRRTASLPLAYVPAIHVFPAPETGYRLVSRQPAASASSTEQNQRVPLAIFILICVYQRLVG